MEKSLKIIIKRAFITSIIILVYGLIMNEQAIYVSMFVGSIISIFAFYTLIRDAEYIIYTKSNAFKTTMIGYLKRYLMYGVFLYLTLRYHFSWGILGAVGLLNIKFNLLLNTGLIYYDKFSKRLNK